MEFDSYPYNKISELENLLSVLGGYVTGSIQYQAFLSIELKSQVENFIDYWKEYENYSKYNSEIKSNQIAKERLLDACNKVSFEISKVVAKIEEDLSVKQENTQKEYDSLANSTKREKEIASEYFEKVLVPLSSLYSDVRYKNIENEYSDCLGSVKKLKEVLGDKVYEHYSTLIEIPILDASDSFISDLHAAINNIYIEDTPFTLFKEALTSGSTSLRIKWLKQKSKLGALIRRMTEKGYLSGQSGVFSDPPYKKLGEALFIDSKGNPLGKIEKTNSFPNDLKGIFRD